MSACVRCQGLGVIFTAPVTVLWGRSAPVTGLVIPPIPDGLCGNRGCVFTARHDGPHSWARRWGESVAAIIEREGLR